MELRLHLCENVSTVLRVSLLMCNMRGCYCTFTLFLRLVFLNQAHVSLHSRIAFVQKHKQCMRAAKSRPDTRHTSRVSTADYVIVCLFFFVVLRFSAGVGLC